MDATQETDKEQETAVPYVPPPPPRESTQKKLRSPLVNGALVAVVILIGGVMTYNFVGSKLTHLAAESTNVPASQVSQSPSSSPSTSPSVSPAPSLSPTSSPAPTVAY